MFKLLLKQNPAPEPDVQQPFYSPVSQRAVPNNTVSNHEPTNHHDANHETTDENDNENDGLIDEDSSTPQQQEPYMRATRTVSVQRLYYNSHLFTIKHYFVSMSIINLNVVLFIGTYFFFHVKRQNYNISIFPLFSVTICICLSVSLSLCHINLNTIFSYFCTLFELNISNHCSLLNVLFTHRI